MAMTSTRHDMDGLVLAWNCSTVDCLLMQWTFGQCPVSTSKSTIVVENQAYAFDGFYLLSHRVFTNPPPFEFVRDNITCTVKFVREELPSELIGPSVRLRISGFQDYLFWQLLRIPPSQLFPNQINADTCAPFHIYPRFVASIDPTIARDLQRVGYATGPLLPIDMIMDYLDASAMTTADMFMKEFPPEALLHHVVSCEDASSQLGCFRIDMVTPQKQLIHDGRAAPGFDGVEDLKKAKKWQEVAPVKGQSPTISSMMKILYPSTSFLTGLKSDVFEVASALPLVFRFLRHCAEIEAFEVKWQLNFRDKALLRQAFTHMSYVDCGVQHANTLDAVLARVQMGHTFKSQSKPPIASEAPPIETSLDSATKAHIDGDFKPRRFSHFLCPYERLEFLGDAVLSFLVSSNIFLQFPDVSEGDLHDLRTKIVNNETMGDLAKTCMIDKLILTAFDPTTLDEQTSTKIAADCVEAILGAIFYEQGWNDGVVTARAFLRQLFVVFDQELADYVFLLSKDLAEKVSASLNTHLEAFEKHPKAQEMTTLHKHFLSTCSIPIQRPHLWLQALTHKSFKGPAVPENEFVLGKDGNYERLEFLGDSILQVVTSRVLMDVFPHHQEDLLSSVRSSLVSNARLATVGGNFQYTKFIRFGQNVVSNGLNLPSVLADVFEACLAAMYLEHLNLEAIEQFLQSCLFPLVHDAVSNREWMGPKQKLLNHVKQWPHTSKIHVQFEALECKEANMHAVALSVDGYLICRAMAPTKEMAADKAAQKAMHLFGL
ncbi:hypothetical protein AeMF1_009613 [Aphanomyces euteiches]|nr:hypothetical protein AeMF1_009613 [Aphanomyces euteiches]KAH9198018.1 hypothetical protein AeNC1_000025 [Aphanomyces euteiches]